MAIITGGAKGLGEAMAKTFASQGAIVYAADMGDLEYSHKNVIGYKLNVTHFPSIEAFVKEV